ncbi:MAG: serine/threonine-protein kinase [Gemmatimonadota bacterium]
MLPELPCDIEDRYTVVAELGRGSHAIVYQAHDRVLERDVAIKVLREELVDSSVSERFRREIRLTSKLDHPHIAHVYGTGEWRGAPYFVIALARGPSLAERLAREHQLPVDEALSITRQVAAALGHAHKAGIIHRDVKPANILLTPDGALLTDFGVARALEYSAGTLATSTGTAVGTLQYMSPEQLCAEKGIDGRSDQYELALVLYEMLAGVPPHVAANTEGLRALRLVGQQVPVRTHRPSVPQAVEDAIERALCPTPADRFASMGEFVAALDGGSSGSGALRVSAARRTIPSSVAGPVRAMPGGMRRWLVPGVAVLAAVTAVVIAAPRFPGAGQATPEALASDVNARAFHLVAVGDTTRSAPMARVLSDELAAWPDVQAGVALSATAREGGTRLDVRASSIDGGTQVTAQVRVGAAMRRVTVRLPATDSARGDSLRLLAARVLMAQQVAPDSAEPLTFVRDRPTAAVRQFGEGWASVVRGDLDVAAAEFAEAGRSGALPQAVLWQAIVGSWRQPKVPAAWREQARTALAAQRLTLQDSLLATGIFLRATDDMQHACAAFVTATRLGGGSFAAWYGLGDCLQTDSVVLRDRSSPTGYRFRTSYWSALRAYDEAIRRLQSPHLVRLFDRLPRAALAVNPSQRTGVLELAVPMQGLPSVQGDSVVVYPIQSERMRAGGRGTIPATFQTAVRRGRLRLLEIAASLASRAPRSLPAQLLHARALEYAGILESPGQGSTALSTLRTAANLAVTRSESLQVGLSEVRVMLRTGDFTGARAVSTRLLTLRDSLDRAAVRSLLSLAVIVNATDVTLDLFTRATAASAVEPDGLVLPAAAAAARYAVSASRGDCAQLAGRRAAARSALQAAYSPAETDRITRDILSPSDWMALTCPRAVLPANAHPSDPIIRAFALLGRGKMLEVRRLLQSMMTDRAGAAATSITWDTRFIETWLLLRTGDSTSARNRIRTAMTEFSGSMDFVLFDPAQGAGLRRSLELCATLEWPAGERIVGSRCRDALVALTWAERE